MVLVFTTTLLLSVLALGCLIYAKHWELQTGRVILSGVRPRVGGFFEGVLLWIEQVFPALARIHARRAARAALVALQHGLARLIIVAESTLERALHTLRRSTEPAQSHGEPSAFLREVAEHKRTLIKRSGQESAE